MKPLLIAAALLLIPAAAEAQVAAGAVPNTFDGPAAQVAPVPEPRSAPAAVAATPANPASEEALRAFIAAAQAGSVDYTGMTAELAEKVREQEATVMPLIQGFGPVVAVDFAGSRDSIDIFGVIFANAATQWMIGHNEAGEISALLFRPAPEAAAPAAE